MKQDDEKRDPLPDDTEADRFDDALRLLVNTPPKPKKDEKTGTTAEDREGRLAEVSWHTSTQVAESRPSRRLAHFRRQHC